MQAKDLVVKQGRSRSRQIWAAPDFGAAAAGKPDPRRVQR